METASPGNNDSSNINAALGSVGIGEGMTSASSTGYRAGVSCPFLHVDQPSTGSQHQQRQRRLQRDASSATPAKRQYQQPPVDSTRVVPRPTPKAQIENPREFQIGQIHRRFAPVKGREENHGDPGSSVSEANAEATILEFRMKPSDPDFPFELEGALECVLRVPKSYLAPETPDATPTLGVMNKGMPRGYQINVEKGFDELLRTSKDLTLLQLMNALDKRLESLLSAEKAETIKIVANAKKSASTKKGQIVDQSAAGTSIQISVPSPSTSYTPEQKAKAASKRETDVRQLEARLGRNPLFSKSGDGSEFTIPMDPRKRVELPADLQAVRTAKLIVSPTFNLEPCRIQLIGVTGDSASRVEHVFAERAGNNPEMSLMNHINYLAQNMRLMVSQDLPKEQRADRELIDAVSPLSVSESTAVPALESEEVVVDPDRPHIMTITRPPEWDTQDGADESDESDDSFDDYDSEEGTDQDEVAPGTANRTVTAAPTSERGVAISFPNLELYGIELLELVSLNVSVKCARCKEITDVNKLKHNTSGDYTGVRSESCRKCANPLGIGYRMDLMHSNSVRAGYLDLDGCTVTDMLPSNFIPTCSECSTPHPAPGVVSVRSQSSIANCRQCHRQMSTSSRFLHPALSTILLKMSRLLIYV